MTKLTTLNDGFIDQLKDLYSAESQLLKALPKMERKASNQGLKEAFRSHLGETEQQLRRLDKIGAKLKTKLSGKTCKAMQGLIEEGKEALEAESDNEALVDVLLIAAAQRVEHYEMAAYGSARAIALQLDEDGLAAILQESLDEERAADSKLGEIAEKEVLCDADCIDLEEEDDERQTSIASDKTNRKRSSTTARTLAAIGCLFFASASGTPVSADTGNKQPTQYEADNTGRNVRDQNSAAKTADSQRLSGSEIDLLARVRREIIANDSLSTNGHNVKIVIDNGTVVLRGPVNSATEKSWIESTTARVASGYRVVNQLEIAAG